MPVDEKEFGYRLNRVTNYRRIQPSVEALAVIDDSFSDTKVQNNGESISYP
jgi:hypothetical protein